MDAQEMARKRLPARRFRRGARIRFRAPTTYPNVWLSVS
jgi:hypothetical protein